MRVIFDTHALLWWLSGDERLPRNLRPAIEGRAIRVFVSAANGWEITTKFRVGKLPHAAPFAADVENRVRGEGFFPLAITMQHAQRAGGLRGPDRDPFDRMLAAQALIEDLPIVSNDRVFDRFGVRRLW